MEVHPGGSGFPPGEGAGELTRLQSEIMYVFIQMNSFKSLRRCIVLIAIQCKICPSKTITTWFGHVFQSTQ